MRRQRLFASLLVLLTVLYIMALNSPLVGRFPQFVGHGAVDTLALVPSDSLLTALDSLKKVFDIEHGLESDTQSKATQWNDYIAAA